MPLLLSGCLALASYKNALYPLCLYHGERILQLSLYLTHAPVAQWIERLRPKEGVGSSILSGGTILKYNAYNNL